MLEEANNSAIVEDVLEGEKQPGAKARRRRRGIDRMTIGVIALIALSAAGVYYMQLRTAKTGAAIGQASKNAASVQTLLQGGQQGLVTLSKNIAQTRDTIEGFSERDSIALANAKPLERDPFKFDAVELPSSVAPTLGANKAARETARADALVAAKKLQLQSIMYGSARRSCLIDGKLYFEGQSVGGFIVGQIAPGSITVQREEFTFELRLRK